MSKKRRVQNALAAILQDEWLSKVKLELCGFVQRAGWRMPHSSEAIRRIKKTKSMPNGFGIRKSVKTRDGWHCKDRKSETG
jgi:hypothetical protein